MMNEVPSDFMLVPIYSFTYVFRNTSAAKPENTHHVCKLYGLHTELENAR